MKLVAASAALLVSTSMLAAGERVFHQGTNNANIGAGNTYGPSALTNGNHAEKGDEIVLGGTARNITQIDVFYIFNTSTLVGTNPQGDEFIRLRIYEPDATTGEPSTVLWDSGAAPVSNQPAYALFRVARFDVPNITVPDRIIVTTTEEGTAQITGDQVGPSLFGPPTVGTVGIGGNGDLWWNRAEPTAVWGQFLYTGPLTYGHFGMHIWAGGGAEVPYDNSPPPDPATIFYPPVNATATGQVECGDDMTLTGNNKSPTSADVYYAPDMVAPAGDETITLRLYTRDNTLGTNGGGPPTTVLFASTPILVPDTTAAVHMVNIPIVYNGALPSEVYWTTEFLGTGAVAGDRVAVVVKDTGPSCASHRTFGRVVVGAPTVFGTNRTLTGIPASNLAFKLNANTNNEHLISSVGPGSTLANSSAAVRQSDDVRWETRPGAILVATAFPERVTWTFVVPSATVSAMNFNIESSATVAGIRQKVSIMNDTGGFVDLEDFTPLPFGANPDRSVSLAVPGTVTDYIRDNGTVTIRTDHKNTTAVLVYPWRVRYDRVYLNYTP